MIAMMDCMAGGETIRTADNGPEIKEPPGEPTPEIKELPGRA